MQLAANFFLQKPLHCVKFLIASLSSNNSLVERTLRYLKHGMKYTYGRRHNKGLTFV